MTLKTGAPLAKPEFETKDSKTLETAKKINDFTYKDQVCPISAHIRKTNIRETVFTNNDGDKRAPRTRIIRNGIPYGSDYKGHENDESKRGLLFVCYQGHIEDGFQHMQKDWSNCPNFRSDGVGLDPIIGQVNRKKTPGGKVTTVFRIPEGGEDREKRGPSVEFEPLVTLKGGEYFFVPSISALGGELAKT